MRSGFCFIDPTDWPYSFLSKVSFLSALIGIPSSVLSMTTAATDPSIEQAINTNPSLDQERSRIDESKTS